jgi:hypothetical protein
MEVWICLETTEFASRPCILRNQYPWDEEILVEDWTVKRLTRIYGVIAQTPQYESLTPLKTSNYISNTWMSFSEFWGLYLKSFIVHYYQRTIARRISTFHTCIRLKFLNLPIKADGLWCHLQFNYLIIVPWKTQPRNSIMHFWQEIRGRMITLGRDPIVPKETARCN